MSVTIPVGDIPNSLRKKLHIPNVFSEDKIITVFWMEEKEKTPEKMAVDARFSSAEDLLVDLES